MAGDAQARPRSQVPSGEKEHETQMLEGQDTPITAVAREEAEVAGMIAWLSQIFVADQLSPPSMISAIPNGWGLNWLRWRHAQA